MASWRSRGAPRASNDHGDFTVDGPSVDAALIEAISELHGDAGYDFCGGGWLFVHTGGVWSEQ